ncbi:uncharacterized protein [Physcomitrium patens]|uniref:C3H1-type domain-containing protein n=1 Tax=Physcomitrium patens TaxID=3218 RepID=A0A2K1KID3_PHYPA|nr:uncharacterized protein LOC112282379 [Physcomitrium patens]PNR53537.1 hypothetical protein PHYPA_007212 [Physcomitrium patens]|eukprot:XP_024375670.1 uncharacterized protein LOC112282379 [Physcomitrella patens]
MEQDDEEFEQLLHEIPQATSPDTPNEIPRATSAPPHLEELQRVYGQNVDARDFGLQPDEVPVKPFIDIRCDEQYEDFYKSYSGAKKLPPPMDNRALYNDFPVLSPKASQLSYSLAGLQLDSPRTRHRKHRQLEAQHKQQQVQQQQMFQQREPSPNHHTAAAHHFPNSSSNQMFGEPKMTSAFGNLNFDGSSGRGLQTTSDETGDGLTLSHGANGGNISNSQGPVESNGMYGNMDAFGGVGTVGYGAGSGASLETFTSRSPPPIDLFPRTSSAVEALGNGLYNGISDFSQVSSQAVEKLLRQGSPGLNSYSAPRGGEAYGSAVASSYEQQQQSEVLEAVHAAARGQSASTPGTDFYSPSSQQQILYDKDISSLYEAQRLQAQMAAIRYAQAQAQMEDEKRKQQQRLIIQQHQQQIVDRQNQILLASLQAQQTTGPYGRGGIAPTMSSIHNQVALQKLRQQQMLEGLWAVQGLVPTESSRTTTATSICRYYNQGYCSRGEMCPFLHAPSGGSTRVGHGASASLKEGARSGQLAAVSRDERLPAYPEKILQRRSARASNGGVAVVSVSTGLRRKGDGLSNGHANGYSNGHIALGGAAQLPSPFIGDSQAHRAIQENLEFDSRLSVAHHLQQQQPKYTKLDEVEGRIYLIAKDQHGCRFLQKKFDEGGPEDVQKIFYEIIGHITELMKDPFGNYLVQKLLEVCDESQRMEILRVVTTDGELVKISLNMHGTRAVQKLIETLKSPDQVTMVITALTEGVVELIKDLNGNHVVQRCLQKLSHEDSQFIFDAAAAHCVEIATHRHGCCVMQRCVDFASAPQKQRLVAVIAANALTLSQDPYGNYVVQYILDLKQGWATSEVMLRLEGSYAFLAMQKFSSNVVEKCLKLGVEEHRGRLVRELTASSRLGQLLQDQYANYVIQSALSVCKGPLHAGLVDAIRPYLPALRNSPYGKRILSRTNIKK